MLTAREKRAHTVSGLIRFAATQLAVAGWLATTLPSTAVTRPIANTEGFGNREVTIPSSYRNRFRGCAGRLLSVGISSDAAATACAGALSPRDLSRCVLRIREQTALAAEDALSSCRQARRPNDLASCVVGISRNNEDEDEQKNEEQSVPGVLDYCGRSLLPVRFGECVVGLRREIDVASTQAMESCISATDQLPPRDFSPTFVPQDGTPPIQPNITPALPQNQTTPNQLAPAPLPPQNQTTPNPLAPAPLPPQERTTPNQLAPAPATP